MDEELTIISNNTRNEKIINFFKKNKNKLILVLSTIIFLIISFLFYENIQKKRIIELSDKYSLATVNFISGKKDKAKITMIEIINNKNKTYSPLALYFLIDNKLVESREDLNKLFDLVISIKKLDQEIRNLILYKKGLHSADFLEENELIKILNPILNSKSIWKSHALYLAGEYFFHKNEKQKAKEFFEQILILENSNQVIKKETIKRIQRDFSE
jgi:predicted negative regulator of RcsB-dependent stress response